MLDIRYARPVVLIQRLVPVRDFALVQLTVVVLLRSHVVELASDLVSVPASEFGAGFVDICINLSENDATIKPLGGFFGVQISTTDPCPPVLEKRRFQKHDLEQKRRIVRKWNRFASTFLFCS